MRVSARLSAVQRLKQHPDEQQNGEQIASTKRGRTRKLAQQDTVHFGQSMDNKTQKLSAAAERRRQQQQQGVVRAADFDWEQYLATRGGTDALNGHLFQHQQFVERTLAQHIFRPGRSVCIQCTQNDAQNRWVAGRIGVTFPSGQAVVEIPASAEQTTRGTGRATGAVESGGGARTEIVKLDLVELTDDDAKDMEDADDFRSILRERREWLGRKLHTFIQDGQLFELQEAPSFCGDILQNIPSSSTPPPTTSSSTSIGNFLRVHTVRIVGHRNGFVMTERVAATGAEDGRQKCRELVHITSERCHPFGWTRSQHPSDNYALIGGDCYDHTQKTTVGAVVPRWMFRFRPLATHQFEVGMLLEMLDPLNRLSFVPAYVSERVNSHYFKVRPIRNVQSVADLLHTAAADHVVHCASPDIFPVGWCFKNQIRLTFPQGLNQADASSSYATLRLKLRDLFAAQPHSSTSVVASAPLVQEVQAVQQQCEYQTQQVASCSTVPSSSLLSDFITLQPKAVMGFNFAPDSLFDMSKMVQKRLECVRYCEVQDTDDPTLFHPGAIVRSRQHLIWVHVERDEHTHRPAQIYTVNSPQLFRCGTAKKAAAALPDGPLAAALRYFTVPIRIPPALSADCRRTLLRSFTCQRLPSAFRAVPKHFISEMWLKADLWLPTIYLSANCFCGPFLVPDKVRALPARYDPSPLPHAISTLVKDLLACGGSGGVGTRGVRELADLVEADRNSRAPLQMLLKLKYANRRMRVSVETCERATQFPGWLRMLLIRLDACPNLLSLERGDKCSLNCSTAGFSSSPYLSHNGHANTASQQSSQQQTNKLNQAAQQLKKVAHHHQKRMRANGRNKKTKRSADAAEEALKAQPRPSSAALEAKRQPSKRLSIAQPVVDDDDREEDEDEADNGTTVEEGKARKRRRRRRKNSKDDDDEGIASNEEEEDNDIVKTASTSSSSSSNNSSQQQQNAVVVDDQQQRLRSTSSSSTSTNTDVSAPSSPTSSRTSAATTSKSMPAITAPPQTPPLLLLSSSSSLPAAVEQQQHGAQLWTDIAATEERLQPVVVHQQWEMKREQANSDDEVLWHDNYMQMPIQHAPSNKQPQRVSVQQQQQPMHPQHYTAPLPVYTPYLYAAHHPHQYNPYTFCYAIAPPSSSACPPSSSSGVLPTAPAPFLHPHPPPPHMHLMAAPPLPPMFPPPLPPASAIDTASGTVTTNNGNGSNKTNFECPTVDSNPVHWSAEGLCRWLSAAGFADCAQRLLNEEVDGASLLLFTPIHYQNLGLKLGPMVKLQQMVEYLRQFAFASAAGAKQ